MLMLTDSANAFISGHCGNPRSVDLHTRIHMRYRRDGVGRYNLACGPAGFNEARPLVSGAGMAMGVSIFAPEIDGY